MNAFGLQPLFEAFGWMFIHSLWQGLLIFGLLKIFLHSTKNQTAGFRYTLILISMSAMSVWAILTFVNYLPSQMELNGFDGFATSAWSDTDPEMVALSEFSFQNPDSWGLSFQSFLPMIAPWVFTLWLIGVGIMGLRLMGNFLYLNQFKRLKSFPAGPDLQKIVQHLSVKAGIKRAIHLRISNRIFEPITFGFLKPVILLPASILSHIPPDQLEALILHEMAHIHRFDYLVNLIQMILEICFFYHPVVWWLSTQLREERELSCDEWVITYGAEKSEYAQALIFLEKQKLSFRNQLAMSAKGNKSSLTQRILRLYETQSASPSFTRGIFAFIFLVVLFTGIAVGPRIFSNKSNVQKELVEINIPAPPAPPTTLTPPPPTIAEIIIDENEAINNSWKIIPKGSGVVISPEFGLYIVNNQEGGKELLEKVTRTNIQSAEALGPIDAMKAYGPKGKDGAFIIQTSDQPLMEGFYFGHTTSELIEFGFKTNRAEVVKIQIIDSKKAVFREFLHETLQPGNHQFDLDISDFPNGKYHLIVLAGGLQHSFKIKKEVPPPPPPPAPKQEEIEKQVKKVEEVLKKLQKEEAKAKDAIPGVKNLATEMIVGDNHENFTFNLNFDLKEEQSVQIFVLDKETNEMYHSIAQKILTPGKHEYSFSTHKSVGKHLVGMMKTAKGETSLFDVDFTD